MQGVLRNPAISYAGGVVSGGIAFSTQVSVPSKISLFPGPLALPSRPLGVSFLLLETVRRVTGQQYPQEGAAARVTLHSNMSPSPENGPQVLSENLEGGAGSGERSVP